MTKRKENPSPRGGARPGSGLQATPKVEVTPRRVRVSLPYDQPLTFVTRDNLGYVEWTATGVYATPSPAGLLRFALADGRTLELSLE
jgi:hypothetical protein